MLFENPMVMEIRKRKVPQGNIPDSLTGIDWAKRYEYVILPKAHELLRRIDIIVSITSKNIIPPLEIDVQYIYLVKPLKDKLDPVLEEDFIQYAKLIAQIEHDIQTNVFEKNPSLSRFIINESVDDIVRRMKLGLSLGGN